MNVDPRFTPAAGRQRVFNLPPVLVGTIAVLFAVHVLRDYVLGPDAAVEFLLALAFIPIRVIDAAVVLPGGAGARIWTFLTYAFLHADWAHLIFNTLWLAAFGSPLAWRFGTVALPRLLGGRRGRRRAPSPRSPSDRHGAAGRRLGGDLGAHGGRSPVRLRRAGGPLLGLQGAGAAAYRRPAPPLAVASSATARVHLPRACGSDSTCSSACSAATAASLRGRSPGRPISAASSPASCSFRSSIRSRPHRLGVRSTSVLLQCILSSAARAPIVADRGAGGGHLTGGRPRSGPAARRLARLTRIKEVAPMIVAHMLASKGRDVATTTRRQDDTRRSSPSSRRAKIGALVVVEIATGIVGIVSERDIVRAIAAQRRRDARPIRSSTIMTRDVVTCGESDTINSVMTPDDARPLPPLPVVAGRPAGRHRLDRRRGQGADRGGRARGRRDADLYRDRVSRRFRRQARERSSPISAAILRAVS